MNYQQILPLEPLRKYIRYFWTLEDDSIDFSIKTFKIISDGHPGLILQQNPKAFINTDSQQLPQLFIYGQTTKHTRHIAKENFRNIGICFQPNALKSIFGIDAKDLTDQSVDINELIKSNISDQLSNAQTLKRQIEILSTFLLNQISQRKTESRKIDFAIFQLQHGKGLQQIQSELKISERSLERYFKLHIGISPKLYSRINRFQSALENIRQSQFNKLTDIAYQSDYFDQSHFIRDFKEFAGTSPKQFIFNANEQVANYPEWKR